MRAHANPSFFAWQKNGALRHAQTVQDISTKLGTFTHRTIPLRVAEPEFQNSSARGRFIGEIFSHFAIWSKIGKFKNSEKITIHRRQPYAHFGVEIMLKCPYLAKISPKNGFKSRDLADFRYNAL